MRGTHQLERRLVIVANGQTSVPEQGFRIGRAAGEPRLPDPDTGEPLVLNDHARWMGCGCLHVKAALDSGAIGFRVQGLLEWNEPLRRWGVRRMWCDACHAAWAAVYPYRRTRFGTVVPNHKDNLTWYAPDDAPRGDAAEIALGRVVVAFLGTPEEGHAGVRTALIRELGGFLKVDAADRQTSSEWITEHVVLGGETVTPVVPPIPAVDRNVIVYRARTSEAAPRGGPWQKCGDSWIAYVPPTGVDEVVGAIQARHSGREVA